MLGIYKEKSCARLKQQLDIAAPSILRILVTGIRNAQEDRYFELVEKFVV